MQVTKLIANTERNPVVFPDIRIKDKREIILMNSRFSFGIFGFERCSLLKTYTHPM